MSKTSFRKNSDSPAQIPGKILGFATLTGTLHLVPPQLFIHSALGLEESFSTIADKAIFESLARSNS